MYCLKMTGKGTEAEHPKLHQKPCPLHGPLRAHGRAHLRPLTFTSRRLATSSSPTRLRAPFASVRLTVRQDAPSCTATCTLWSPRFRGTCLGARGRAALVRRQTAASPQQQGDAFVTW